jgi:flagellar hook-associated protein 1 FlgK
MIAAFAIGTSALDTAQSALNVIGQNISNATTTGYHDQAVDLVNTASGNAGTGVDVATITRYADAPIDTAVYASNSAQAATGAQLAIGQQVQTALNSGTGGIGDQLNGFFNQVDELTSQPDSTAQRQQVISTAGTLANQLNAAAGSIDQLRADTGTQIRQGITQVNKLATQIAGLNSQISVSVASGQQPNNLLDQRDDAITSLSQLIGIRTVNQPNGVVNVLGESGPVVVGQFATSFQVAADPAGNLTVSQSDSSQPVTIDSGSIGGRLQAYNTGIPATTSQLDALAGRLAQQVNQIQATGLGTTGPFAAATGSVSAASAAAPLSAAGLPFPVTAGQLTVSVTDAAGNRANSTIAINPATDSLQSLAAALNGVTGLQASVTPGNQLQIKAQSGYSFDFAGRDTNPPGTGAVANPDTAGVLSALGVNGLFTGSTAVGTAVDPALVSNPGQLAASTTGEPGDSTNLQRLSAVQDQALIGGQTLADNFATQAAAVGNDVQTLTDQQTAQTGVAQSLTTQAQSVSGVDTNDEFIHLLSYQKLIQGASEYLTTVNTAIGYVFNIIQ